MHPAVELPHPRAIARHAIPHIIEGTLVPLAVFYVAMWAAGVWGAAFAVDVGLRHGPASPLPPAGARHPLIGCPRDGPHVVALRRQRLPLLPHRPGTVLVAGLFLLSVPIGKPLAERLARDFCPLPEALLARPFMRTFFMRISLLWAAVFLTNASVSFYLLLNQSVGAYVITKQALSSGLWIAAIGTSVWYFLRLMRRHGINPRFTGTVVG